jgi:hypothetical protein
MHSCEPEFPDGLCFYRDRLQGDDPVLSINLVPGQAEQVATATASVPYLITLSALANTFGGIVRPICLAVLRFITNSNLLGCSTGMSAGCPFEDLIDHRGDAPISFSLVGS